MWNCFCLFASILMFGNMRQKVLKLQLSIFAKYKWHVIKIVYRNNTFNQIIKWKVPKEMSGLFESDLWHFVCLMFNNPVNHLKKNHNNIRKYMQFCDYLILHGIDLKANTTLLCRLWVYMCAFRAVVWGSLQWDGRTASSLWQ